MLFFCPKEGQGIFFLRGLIFARFYGKIQGKAR